MTATRLAFSVFTVAGTLIACDSSTTGVSGELAEVRFVARPADVTAGTVITPAVQVELLGADGSPLSNATVEVTVQIGANPGGGRLSGTTQVTSVNGIASFSDISIDRAGSGYTLWASLAELRDTSSAFAITAGSPAQLAFVSQPVADTARTTLAPFVVEVQDQLGNRIEGAVDMVTVALGDNPGSMIFHASGSSAVNRVLQYVDPLTPEVLPALSASPASEISGMTLDATTGNVLAVNVGTELLEIDPLTGTANTIGDHGVLPLRGITWESGGAGRLLASQPHKNELYELNPTTAVATLLGSLDIANDSVLGINGLATDPTDGTVYAIVRLRDAADRKRRDLVTINLNSLMASSLGTLSEDGVASLAFYPNGTLYAATGDGATNPESLWRVDKTDASMTLIIPMGDGDDGEAIAYIPAHLGGTLAVAASDGVALFADLMIDAPADGYTLIATAPGLTAAVSVPFDIIRP
jgi:hypothetical protein